MPNQLKRYAITVHVDRVHDETREAILSREQYDRARWDLNDLKAEGAIESFQITELGDTVISPEEFFRWLAELKGEQLCQR